MWPSSVRRAASVASQSSPILSALVPAAPAFIICSARRPGFQQRYSSSKTSSSDNGPKNVAARSSVTPAVEREAKPSGEKRKRRSKSSKATSPKRLPSESSVPSVPSTGHLSRNVIGLTSFFSMHRPISVTDGFPTTVSDDTFASIFASGGSSRPTDVISTLSGAVEQLEQPRTRLVIKDESGGADREFNLHQQMEDALPTLFDQLNAMAGRFSPFTSPPAPQLEGTIRQDSAAEHGMPLPSETTNSTSGDQHVQYRAMITIDQTTKPDGRVEMIAHSPEIMVDTEETETRRGRARRWNAISVKRIRKLKMKKHKYKKLMRKTRNIRRKLDRL